MLAGTPTLRTREGERELAPRRRSVAFLPRPPAAPHQVLNRSDVPARVLIAH